MKPWVKIGLTVIAIVFVLIPEGVSTLAGMAFLAALWGVDWGRQ